MTPKKPIIGITPSHNTENNDTSLRPTYPKAIAAAGELSILLPLECSDEDIKQFMDVCDGFLFTGGPDINPFLFGEDTHLKCGNISAARDHLEFRLLSAAMNAKKPVFGICRGIQVLNVGLGGSCIRISLPRQNGIFPSPTNSHFTIISPVTVLMLQRILCFILSAMQESDFRKQLPSPEYTYSGTGIDSFCRCSRWDHRGC